MRRLFDGLYSIFNQKFKKIFFISDNLGMVFIPRDNESVFNFFKLNYSFPPALSKPYSASVISGDKRIDFSISDIKYHE